LLLMSNRKSYVGFPLVPKSTTLDDLEPARLSRAYLSVS